MTNKNKVSLTEELLVQTQDGQFIKGQFLIENLSVNAICVSRFIADINYEMVYMNVEGDTFFANEEVFHEVLNANEHGEVFGKANFECDTRLITETKLPLHFGGGVLYFLLLYWHAYLPTIRKLVAVRIAGLSCSQSSRWLRVLRNHICVATAVRMRRWIQSLTALP